MKKGLILGAILLANLGFSQSAPSTTGVQDPQNQINAAQRILSGNAGKKITIGGYAEIDYNEQEGSSLGQLDVHRMVMLVGYQFDEKTSFVTELEFEHVKEIFVEQAFIQHKLTDNFNLRAGLMLVPMGIVNEYHEPTTFNGVERPSMDGAIVPTTWREIGAGFTGRVDALSLRYQAYVMNGFISSTESSSESINVEEVAGEFEVTTTTTTTSKATLGGSRSLRGGRQKGAESVFSSPTFSGKIDYYGIKGLRLGLSSYFGDTQFGGEDEIDGFGTTVNVRMTGLDARYKLGRFSTRGQFVYADINGAGDYNTNFGLTNNNDKLLGKAMQGYYLEAAYNVLPAKSLKKLDAFVRYENFDNHHRVSSGETANKEFHRIEWTTGLSYHVSPGAVFKVDYQLKDNTAFSASDVKDQFNLGFGVWF